MSLRNYDRAWRVNRLCASTLGLIMVTTPALALTLNEAERAALDNERGAASLQRKSLALGELAIAGGQLPDPVFQVGGNNLPVDTFDLDQEPMTQMRLGLKQSFPGGQTRALRREQTQYQSEATAHLALERQLRVIRDLRHNWFEALYWVEAKKLLDEDRALFSQLLETTGSLYRVGKKSQHDLVRAELEVSQLEDRVIRADRQLDIQKNAIARWIQPASISRSFVVQWHSMGARHAPTDDQERLVQLLYQHPMLRSIASEVEFARKAVQLARESYKPDWSLELGYGFRDGRNIDGTHRADFVSVAASIQLPLFVRNRQDRVSSARAYQYEAARDQQLDALHQLMLDVQSTHDRWQQLQQRLALYETSILPQANMQSTATLTAYQSDATDFAELMRAYLSEQALKLEHQRLRVDEQKTLAQLHYLLPTIQELEELQAHE